MAEAVNDNTEEPKIEKAVRPAIFASSMTLSEYSLYIQRLLTGLADESIPTALICPDELKAAEIVSPTVTLIRHPQIRLPLFGSENRKILIEKLIKFKPTVLHCLSESSFTTVRQVSKQLNLPYFVSINGTAKLSSLHSLSANRLAGIITPAESIAAEVARNFPRLQERIELIKMGTFVSEKTASFNKLQRTAVIGAACSVSDKTDFGKMLGAIKKLFIAGHNFMTLIIGDGQDEKALRLQMSALGITKNITIIPRNEPWRAVLSACDIFIEPRQNRYFNLMLLEALAAGVTVAGCKGGVDDLIITAQTAEVLDKNDEHSIFTCIRHFLENPQQARALGASAQNYVRNNHSVSKMFAETIECYRKV